MVRSNLKLFAVFFVPLLLLLAVGCSNDPAANTPAQHRPSIRPSIRSCRRTSKRHNAGRRAPNTRPARG